MSSQAAKDLYIRVSVKDAEKAKVALRTFGKDGSVSIKKIERASVPATRKLKALDGAVRSAQAGMSGYSARLGVVGAALEGFGPAGLVAAAGVGLVTVGMVKSIRVAADVQEQMSKFKAVFKANSSDAEAWATAFGRAINRSRYDLMTYMASFQDTFVPLGYGRSEAAGLSKQLTKLAVDMASFNNEAEPQTVDALTSAIVGNHEAVRKYGIVITESTLKQELMNLGLAESVQKATESQKVQARLSLIMKSTADAQGDAARTSDSYVNKVKGLDAAITDLQVTFGNLLVGPATGVVTFFTDMAMSADWAASGVSKIFQTIDEAASEDIRDRISDINQEIFGMMESIDDWSRSEEHLGGFALGPISRYEKQIKALAEEAARLKAILKDREKPGALAVNDNIPLVKDPAAAEKARGLKTIADLENRAAKATLSNFALIARDRDADFAKVKKLEQDRVITASQSAKATGDVKTYYSRLWEKEMERTLKEEQQQRDQAQSYVEKLSDRRLRAEGTVLDNLKLDREKDLRDLEKKEKKKLLTVEQSAKARAEIEGYYNKKLEKERPKTFSEEYRQEVDSYFDTLANGGRRAGQFVVGAFQSMEDAFTNFFMTGKFTASSFFDSIKVGLARLAAQDMVAGIGSAFGLGSSKTGASVLGSVASAAVGAVSSYIGGFFAEGGRVRGPGTGTSDSILARISDGEYVVNARATEQHLPLLEEINKSGLPGYARGGMVGANDNLPRFLLGGHQDPSTGESHGAYGPEGMSSPFGVDQGPDFGGGSGWGTITDPETGLQSHYGTDSETGKSGVVSRSGGGFWDRIGTFFGVGTKHGFLGSAAAGALTGAISAVLGGPVGMLASLGANYYRADATGGFAANTGVGGFISNVVSGRTGSSFLSAGGGMSGGGVSGRGAVGTRSVSGGNDREISAIVRDLVEVDASPYLSAGLDGLRGRLAGDYQPVVNQGARIMRGLRRGGRVDAGESVVVGEDDIEVFTPDRPGRITPRAELPGTDMSEVVEALHTVVQEIRAMRSDLEQVNEQMAGFAGDYAGRMRVRRTATA